MTQLWKRRVAAGAAAATLVLFVGGVANATDPPGVSPTTYANTLLPGQSVAVAKTVQTSEISPNPDLVFLADTTCSMGGAIGNVQTNGAIVMNDILAAEPASNFGAASYKDFDNRVCGPDPYG